MKDVRIIILNFNSLDYTLQCLESIYRECSGVDESCEIIVLDNGSDVFEGEVIRRKHPEVKIIEAEYNLGFGKANNLAARGADTKYLFFINNDVILLNDVIAIFRDFMEHNPIAAVCGGQQFDQRMKPVRSFNYFPHLFHRVYKIGMLKCLYQPSRLRNWSLLGTPYKVDVLSGTDLFIRTDLFQRIGGFDEGIFLYHEEEDLALRAKKKGRRLFLLPQAKIQHFQGKSSPPKIQVYQEDALSLLYYYRKHRSLLHTIGLRILLALKYFQKRLKYTLRKVFQPSGDGERASIYRRLFLWGLRSFPERQVIENRRNFRPDYMPEPVYPFIKDDWDMRDTPIIIMARDRINCLKRLIDWLERAGYFNIIISDNGSTYPPFLEYISALPYKIIRFNKKAIPRTPWKSRRFKRITRHNHFVVTDSDVIPLEECPHDILSYFKRLLDKYPDVDKVGVSLKIDDLPDSYAHKAQALQHESQFWRQQVEKGVYKALIDTTFALYRPGFTYTCASKGLRTGYPYSARHSSWYNDLDNLPDDEAYYVKNMNQGISWWSDKESTERVKGIAKNSRRAYQ